MPTAHTSAPPPPPPSLIVSLLSPFLRQLKRRVAIHGPYGFVQLSVSSCQALSPSPPPFPKTKPLTNPPLNPLLPHSQRGAPLPGDAGGGGGETAPHAAFVGRRRPPALGLLLLPALIR